MNPLQSHSVHPAAWRNGRSGRLHRSTWVLVDHQGLRILRRAPVFNVVMTVLCVPLFLLLSVPFAFLFGPLGLAMHERRKPTPWTRWSSSGICVTRVSSASLSSSLKSVACWPWSGREATDRKTAS
jgi:hypothetical protein